MKQQGSCQGDNHHGNLEECTGTGTYVPALEGMTFDPPMTRAISQQSSMQSTEAGESRTGASRGINIEYALCLVGFCYAWGLCLDSDCSIVRGKGSARMLQYT